MGAWDILPWDNDTATDWYDELFERTKLATHVEAALKLDPQDSHEKIRAAAAVLLFLGRTYIWPIHDLNRHLELAAARLELVAQVDVIAESPEFVAQIRAEIEELRRRVYHRAASTPAPPPPKPPEKNWWHFWK